SISISSAAASRTARDTGRPSQARTRPIKIFVRSNASRRPSRLITRRAARSARSKVVKRRRHPGHSLRRRIPSPSSIARESRTLLSLYWQYGHRTSVRLFSHMWGALYRSTQGLVAQGEKAPTLAEWTSLAAKLLGLVTSTGDSIDRRGSCAGTGPRGPVAAGGQVLKITASRLKRAMA